MTSQPFFRVLQMVTRWLLAVAWVALTMAVTGLLFFGNFIVAWQAFVLLGFETQPLAEVPLLGPVATAAGVGDAPVAALYAAALSAAMAVTVITACKLGNDALTLFFDFRQARLLGTPDPAAVIKFYETAIAFTLFSALAVTIARYDVSLFSLTLETLVTGIADITESMAWLPEPASRLGAYMAEFAADARWGYLAVIIGVAFTTEKAFQRASERWLVLGQTVDAAILGTGVAQPIEAAGPITPATSEPAGGPAPIFSEAPGVETAPTADGVTEPRRQEAGSPVRPPQPAPPPPVRGPVGFDAAPPPHRGPTVRVICGPGVTRDVAIQDVEKDSEQYVRDGSGRAWFLRAYYNELNGDPRQPEKTENQEADAHV